ncbi:hypothetical protein [Telluribacter sp. SYSU D00476]|uniref:hypothetical protein n=1 Tax=Telluribacter sp. SYSU D00476 TaxID=2811430 RepID=UPI001FF4906F|nr:hypothetical protein [Telluribacter sp. SYSU D00476]
MKNLTQLLLSLALMLAVMPEAQAQALRAGYYGETVTHYGLKVAYELPLRSYVKEKNGAQKTFLFAPGLAAYRHPHNHIGLVLSPELTYRRTSRRGRTFEVGLAPSYFRYFLEGTTYTPDGPDDFKQVRWAGGNAFLPTAFIGIGKDLSVRKNIPLAWYTRLNVMQQRPYNTSTLMRFSLEAGVTIPLQKQ